MRSVKKNFLFHFSYQLVTLLTPLITSPIVSRALGAERLGVFSATLAFVNYFELFAMLGVANYGNRSIASVQDNPTETRKIFWNIYAVQFITSLIAVVCYLVAICFAVPERREISFVQGIWLIGCLTNINWFFYGIEQFKLITIRNVVIKTITVLLIVLFVRSQSDLITYTLIMAGDAAISSIVMWPYVFRYIGFEKPRFKQMKSHLRPNIVLFIPILTLSISRIIDKTMIDMLSTEIQVGYYYSADKVINFPLGVVTALSAVLLPRMSNAYSNKNVDYMEDTIKKSIEVTAFFSCSIGMGIAAIASEFVPLFFGSGFSPCIDLIYLFVPVLFVKAFGELVRSQYLIPTHQDRLYTISTVCGILVNILFNYPLIKRYDALGAVLATLLAELTVTMISLYLTRKQMHFCKMIVEHIAYLLFGFFMLIAVREFSGYIQGLSNVYSLIAMVAVGAAVYLAACTVYWRMRKESVFHGYVMKICK